MPIAICIEAKVDETFGDPINKAYDNALKYQKGKPQSKRPNRIKDLCDDFLGNKSPEEIEYQYQLLHYLAGSIKEGLKIGGVVFMPILVYLTDEYDEKKGSNNRKAFHDFFKAIGFEAKSNKENYEIYEKSFDNTKVYISYIEVNL